MTLFYKRNQKEKQQQFTFILPIICYACAIGGLFRAIGLCWEIGQNNGNFEFSSTIYTFISPIIMIWSSILIALIVRNIRKGIVFETSNAQLITWVGAVVLVGASLQLFISSLADVKTPIAGGSNPMLYYLLGMFIVFIGQIFHIGIRMKEEQDLTI